ncbi:hypothetical protein ACFLY2_02830 [Patescibacteria group bacterium]
MYLNINTNPHNIIDKININICSGQVLGRLSLFLANDKVVFSISLESISAQVGQVTSSAAAFKSINSSTGSSTIGSTISLTINVSVLSIQDSILFHSKSLIAIIVTSYSNHITVSLSRVSISLELSFSSIIEESTLNESKVSILFIILNSLTASTELSSGAEKSSSILL